MRARNQGVVTAFTIVCAAPGIPAVRVGDHRDRRRHERAIQRRQLRAGPRAGEVCMKVKLTTYSLVPTTKAPKPSRSATSPLRRQHHGEVDQGKKKPKSSGLMIDDDSVWVLGTYMTKFVATRITTWWISRQRARRRPPGRRRHDPRHGCVRCRNAVSGVVSMPSRCRSRSGRRVFPPTTSRTPVRLVRRRCGP